MVCQLRNLRYYLNAYYTILYLKGMDSEIQAIEKTNKVFQSQLCVEMPSIMVP